MSAMKHERRPTELSWPDDRIDRVFRDMFRDFFARGFSVDRFFEGWPNPLHVEEFVEGDTCVIRAELPGIDPEKDVDLDVSDGMLHMQARREESNEEDRPGGYHSEFHYGSFERHIRLPEDATESDVKATYKDGILEVRIPVDRKAAEAKKVPVQRV